MIKRKHVFRILLAIGLLLLIMGLAGIAVLRSRAFHRYVLSEMVEKASHATGGRVEIGNYQFRWSGLRLDLYHVVLHGTEPSSRPPLLQIDHLMAGLKIISLWRRKVDLNEMVMDHPSLHVAVDRNGRMNFPQAPPPASGSRPTNVFDLAVGLFVINHGELEYNDRQIPLDGEVHDLYAQASFGSFKTEYTGTLGYHDGRIQYGSFNAIQHSVQAHFAATPEGLTFDSLTLAAGSSTISVQAHVQNYGNPSLDGSYQAALSTGELGHILKAPSFPSGEVDLQGTVHYANRAHQPLLDNVILAGKFHSLALAFNSPKARASVRALAGEFRLSDGTLEARDVQGDVLGGRAYGSLTLTHLSERPAGRVTATVRNISVEAVSTALGTRQLKRAAITGRMNGTMEGSWVGSGENIQLRSDATITASAPVRQGAGSAADAVPLRGTLHLAYNGPSGVISLHNTEFTTRQTRVKLDGSTGKQSSLKIQAHSDDLREVDQLALIARNAGGGGHPSSPLEPFGITGSGSFDGQLRGSINDLHLTGEVSSTNLQYQGTTLTELRVALALSASALTLSQGEIQTIDQGQVLFSLAAGLKDWVYTPQSQVRLDLTAARIPLVTVERLANLHYPVSGTLAAHISMHGSQTNLVGQGTATLASAMVWNQSVQNLSLQFQGAGSAIHSTLQVQTPAGSGSGKFSYDFRSQGYDAQFSAPHLQLEKLQALNQGKFPVTGVVTASLQGRGTVKDPQLTATIDAPKLLIGPQTLDGLKFRADVAQQKAALTVDAASQGASIQARANVNLNANYNATASVDMRNIQLGPLLASFVPQTQSELHGQAELHASLHGPLKQREQIDAEISIPILKLAYQSLQIGNATPIRAVYHGGVVTVEQCALKGTGTDLQLRATVPLDHARSLRASATGDIDLHLIQLLYPQWGSSGQIRLDVGAEGVLPHPTVHGSVRLIDAVVEPPSAPLGVRNVNAQFAIQNGRVDIQSFTGEAGGGTLTAQGFATFQPTVQFNMRVSARRVRLRYPVGTRAILDSTLLLIGSRDSALLSGQVLIDRLSLTQAFDLSTFADQFMGSSTVSPGPSFARNVRLNVAVRSASDMALSNSKLSLQGSANLMVRGTAADPVILGRTDINEGEIFFNKQRYVVESGVIQFVNPVQTEPVLNLHATTTVNQFNITINLVGPIDRMNVTYTSDPPLPPIDIINLIATGKTTEAASTSPTTPQSVIAGQLASQVSNRVEKLAGISAFTIDPQVGSGQGNGVGRLGIQQRVTKNLFFSFSTDLTSSAGQAVHVEYQVTRRFAVSTTRDQNGVYTLQVKMHKNF